MPPIQHPRHEPGNCRTTPALCLHYVGKWDHMLFVESKMNPLHSNLSVHRSILLNPLHAHWALPCMATTSMPYQSKQ
jgi:hypothetical protein